jgi:hypothetical protein
VPALRDIRSRTKRETALAILQSREAELKALGIVRLALFGSTARDGATPRSDADVIVTLTEGPRGFPHLERMDRIEALLEGLLGCPVDVLTDTAGSARTRRAIARDSVNAFQATRAAPPGQRLKRPAPQQPISRPSPRSEPQLRAVRAGARAGAA